MRGRRFFVASLSSVLWPAVVLLVPMGITFAAARVFAETGPLAVPCDGGDIVACSDGGEAGSPCTGCGTTSCGCRQTQCGDNNVVNDRLACTSIVSCADAPTICAGKVAGEACTTTANAAGKCTAAGASCLPTDGGKVQTIDVFDCVPNATGTSSSSSTSSSTSSSGEFVPGPDKVPGSSGATTGDDSGCSTTTGTGTLPLLCAPLAIGLLLALRKRQPPRKEPSARKRS